MGCATSCYFKLSKILSFTAFIGMKSKPKTWITIHSSQERNLLACFDCLEIVDNYRGSGPRIELGSQEPWLAKLLCYTTVAIKGIYLSTFQGSEQPEITFPASPFEPCSLLGRPGISSWATGKMMTRTMSKSLAKPQLFTIDEADGGHT